jgi:hypothetical protein
MLRQLKRQEASAPFEVHRRTDCRVSHRDGKGSWLERDGVNCGHGLDLALLVFVGMNRGGEMS